MQREPIFVTDMMVARGSGFVIVTLNAPAGEFKEGKIENLEIVRVVMSFNTLAAVSALLSKTCQEMGLSSPPSGSANDHAHDGGVDPGRSPADSDAYRLIASSVKH